LRITDCHPTMSSIHTPKWNVEIGLENGWMVNND